MKKRNAAPASSQAASSCPSRPRRDRTSHIATAPSLAPNLHSAMASEMSAGSPRGRRGARQLLRALAALAAVALAVALAGPAGAQDPNQGLCEPVAPILNDTTQMPSIGGQGKQAHPWPIRDRRRRPLCSQGRPWRRHAVVHHLDAPCAGPPGTLCRAHAPRDNG